MRIGGLNGTIPHSETTAASPTYLGAHFELIAVVLTLGSIRNLTVLRPVSPTLSEVYGLRIAGVPFP